MDSLHFSRSRTGLMAAALTLGTWLTGCGSDAAPDIGNDSNANSEGDDDDSSSSSSHDAGKAKDAGKSTTHDAGGSSTTSGSTGGAKDAGTPAKDAGGGKSSGAGGSLPCDIEKIVTTSCGSCHGASPAGGAPMSLTSLADFQADGVTDSSKKVYELAKTRINAKTKPMPPINPLSAADLATLNAWLDKDAPAGTGSCSGSSGDAGAPPVSDGSDIDTTGLDCHKFLAHAEGDKNAKFQLGTAVDRYVNFGFQAPWQGTLYGKLVRPVIDNSKVLHHWLLYREPVADGSIADTIGQHGSGELVHGWAPGGVPMDFTKLGDVAFELPSTTYSVEIHYNSDDPTAQDASGVEVCGVQQKPANIASLSWLGYDQGGTISYATGVCLDPEDTWTGTCAPTAQEPIHILFMVPHLHKTGTHLKSIINSPDGSTRVLHDADFDFAYQIAYPANEVLMPGETITTTCSYSAPNCAGQSTTQEMCYLFTYAYPQYALQDDGPEGAFMHGKGVCLGQ